MSNPFRYRVEFRRTGDWYDSGGKWYEISTWCNRTFGAGNWDYFYDGFVFEKESDYMLFKLKWL
jgi:hypothetical protein